jgi:hypothetical protein
MIRRFWFRVGAREAVNPPETERLVVVSKLYRTFFRCSVKKPLVSRFRTKLLSMI